MELFLEVLHVHQNLGSMGQYESKWLQFFAGYFSFEWLKPTHMTS